MRMRKAQVRALFACASFCVSSVKPGKLRAAPGPPLRPQIPGRIRRNAVRIRAAAETARVR